MNTPSTPGAATLWGLSAAASATPTSGVIDIYNYGRTRKGLIPLWVGEGDMPTPDFICEAAIKSYRDGETFYTYQRGIPPLRKAIAAYMGELYGREFSPESFFVTAGGMHALQIAMRLVAGAGDEVIVPTPAWPNFEGAIVVNGSSVKSVELTRGASGFSLDIGALERAIGPRTRAICLNSPANPTGWVATRQDQERVMELARRHKLWIVADEIYGRFYYEGFRAPSFHDIMAPEDRILFVQTFSKNWAMTGWRIGWIEAPQALGQIIEDLVQYSTSGIPTPAQRGAAAALTQGEALIRQQVERARANREFLIRELSRHNDLIIPRPSGAFYMFFGIEGIPDSRAAALKMVDEANLGLAPGSAFGPGGDGFMRMCYLRKPEAIEATVRRLVAALPRLRESKA